MTQVKAAQDSWLHHDGSPGSLSFSPCCSPLVTLCLFATPPSSPTIQPPFSLSPLWKLVKSQNWRLCHVYYGSFGAYELNHAYPNIHKLLLCSKFNTNVLLATHTFNNCIYNHANIGNCILWDFPNTCLDSGRAVEGSWVFFSYSFHSHVPMLQVHSCSLLGGCPTIFIRTARESVKNMACR